MLEMADRISANHHNDDFTNYISSLQWNHTFSDLTIVCANGKIQSHCAIVGCMSPFLADVLSSVEEPSLFMPNTSVQEMNSLLSLLYSGCANVTNRWVEFLLIRAPDSHRCSNSSGHCCKSVIT